MVVAGISASIFSFTSSYLSLRLQTLIDVRLQSGMWDKLLNLPVAFFRKYNVGDLLKRTLAIAQIRNYLSSSVLSSLFSGVFSIFYIIMMLQYSWKLTILAVLILFFSLVVNTIAVAFKIKVDRKLFLKTIYRLPTVKKVVTVSRGIEKKLNSNYGLKKTKTIYNPIDLKFINQKMLTRRPVDFNYILTVGRLSREKRFDMLIKAFVESKLKNKLKLIIVPIIPSS